MGMFDYVKYSAKCFNCGAELDREKYGSSVWQTKSAKDGEDLMRELQIEDVAENFYSNCDNCDAWNEYDVSSGVPRLKKQEELHETYRIKTPLLTHK